MKSIAGSFACSLFLLAGTIIAQVPQLINYQGRVAVGSINFDGTGQFKFALVNAAGTTSYWSNDGTSSAGSEPTAAVSLNVTKGLYSVLLGDTSLPNMTAISTSVWANADVRLRVWFNDGTNGSQLLTPDQRLAPNGYLPDGAVTSAKMAAGAVGSTQLAAGAVSMPQTIAGTTQAATTNTSYVAMNAAPTILELSNTASNVGDIVQITGAGAGGWSAINYLYDTWTAQPAAGNRAWNAIASSADGSKLVAAEYGGQIYTSTDSGVSWTARESNRNWWSVASSTDGSKLVAVASGGPIYTSTDSGVTWTARDSSRGWQSVASSADGSMLVAVVYGGQIYTSTDSGVNWTLQVGSANHYWHSVASSADGSKLVAVDYFGSGGGGQIWTSTDSGVTWIPRGSYRNWWSVASSTDGSKLVAVASGGQIYTSTDSGVNWTPRESNRAWYSVASSADGSKLVAVENGGRIYISTDSGVSWTPRESNRSWHSVASSADSSKLAAADYGNGLIYTSNATTLASGAQGSSATLQYLGNGQWQTLRGANGTVTSAQLAAKAVHSGNIAVGTVLPAQTIAETTQTATANTSYVATSASPTILDLTNTAANVGDIVQITGAGAGGWSASIYQQPETWTAQPAAGSRPWISVASSADGSKLVAGGNQGQIYTSTDFGVSWMPRESNRQWISVASSADGSKLVAVDYWGNTGEGGYIYTSTDSGVNWTPRESNRRWLSVASSADGSKLVAGVYGGQIYTSTDSGVSWTPRESSRVWLSVASSTDGSKLVAVDYWGTTSEGGYIYTSTDSGVSWTPRESTRKWTSVASSADGSKLVAVVGGQSYTGQIYTSTDFGVSWTARESGRHWFSAASSADGSRLVAADYGGRLYTSADSGVSWTARESNRQWVSVASSADGSRVVAVLEDGFIYTSNATVVTSGAQGSNATLQYLGNGQWAAQGGANGTVTSAQLATNLTLGGTTTGIFSGSGAGLTGIPATAVIASPPGMVLVPAGSFTLGNAIADADITDAAPMATTVSAFYMDANLVTWSQWQSVYYWAVSNGYAFTDTGAGKAANHPAQTINWYDCVKWCNARSVQAGKTPVYYTDAGFSTVYQTGEVTVFPNWSAKGYRLPTEAEWEKAARGGLAGQRFPWCNIISENLANYYGVTAITYDMGPNGYNSIGSVGGTTPATSPIMTFAPNGYGLYDMAGNVWQWCWDWYGTPYAGGTDPHGPASGSFRVGRGGSWSHSATNARCAYRNTFNPTSADTIIGFRTVLLPAQ